MVRGRIIRRMSPAELRQICADALDASRNLHAFLEMIRAGEGTADVDGYRRHFGGRLFHSYVDHPRVAVSAGAWTSTAAGAYQFLARTWDECRAALALPDFSPRSQDLAAVFLIRRRGALPDALAGQLDRAIAKCAREWASLPGSPYGQPTRTLAQATQTYLAAGGALARDMAVAPAPAGVGLAAPAPAADATPASPTAPAAASAVLIPAEAGRPTETPAMLPFVAAALPALIEAAPALIRVFGDSPAAERNAQAAETLARVAREATGQATTEAAVQAIQASPGSAAAYREAVHAALPELADAVATARAADEASRDRALDRTLQLSRESGGRWLYLVGAAAGVVVVASYAIVMLVLLREGFSDETRAMLLGQVVVMGFGTVVAFLFGSNFSNRVEQAARNQGRDAP